jgi:hypothetical protein
VAFAQLRFLRIHSPFYKGGSGAEHAESRTALRGKGAHEEVRAHATVVCERDEGVIVDLHARPTTIELRVHRASWTEQHERLVDEMTSQIEQQPTGVLRRATLAPVVPRGRAPALEPRLEPQGVPQCAFSQQTAEREKISIPSPILEHGHQTVLLFRLGHDCLGFGNAGGEWLVDNHVQATSKGLDGERGVTAVRGRDRDDVELVLTLPELGHRIHDGRVGVCTRRSSSALRVGRHDDGELESRRDGDERRVKRCSSKTIADEAEAKGTRR